MWQKLKPRKTGSCFEIRSLDISSIGLETTENTKYTERNPDVALLFEDESYRILGACFEVYKEKGCGFLEPVYQECLVIEFEIQNIPFEQQVELVLNYKGRALVQRYKPDFVCFGKIVVEIKSVSGLTDQHRAQLHNYLKATGLQLGLLANFGHYPKLEHERIVR
jgi:GxxExxY protein